MATPKQPQKRAKLLAWIDRHKPARIGESEWAELASEIAPVSESYLRRLLRDLPVPLAPLIEGVRQDSYDALERTLLALCDEYQSARETGDQARMAECRRLVITAKDHARWAGRSAKATPEKVAEKGEMAQWMLVWLENPGLFPQWVRLRRRNLACEKPGASSTLG